MIESVLRAATERPVGTDVEQLGVLHLPGHHGLRDAGALQHVDADAELYERDPVHGGRRRRRGEIGELRIRFLLERDDGDVVTRAARRVEHEKREAPVAGDEA